MLARNLEINFSDDGAWIPPLKGNGDFWVREETDYPAAMRVCKALKAQGCTMVHLYERFDDPERGLELLHMTEEF